MELLYFISFNTLCELTKYCIGDQVNSFKDNTEHLCYYSSDIIAHFATTEMLLEFNKNVYGVVRSSSCGVGLIELATPLAVSSCE